MYEEGARLPTPPSSYQPVPVNQESYPMLLTMNCWSPISEIEGVAYAAGYGPKDENEAVKNVRNDAKKGNGFYYRFSPAEKCDDELQIAEAPNASLSITCRQTQSNGHSPTPPPTRSPVARRANQIKINKKSRVGGGSRRVKLTSRLLNSTFRTG